MRRLAAPLLIGILLFFAAEVGAVLLGEPANGTPSPLLRLAFEHQGSPDHQPGWHEDTHAYCSATVVGGRPLTVVTAAHCLHQVRLDGDQNLPVVRILSARSERLARARLRAATYPPFAILERNLAEDLAVLIFDVDADETVQPLAVAPVGTRGRVRICGYGAGSLETDASVPRCADKAVLAGTEDIYHFVPRDYEESDPTLFLQFRAQFAEKAAAISRLDALLAVNRLDAEGRYSKQEPMPVRGDSGGPWLVLDERGNRLVVAVTSFVETFYRKSTVWPIFKGDDSPLSDFPYVAYGIRLDTPEARTRIDQARAIGADIREADPQDHLVNTSASTSSQR